MGVSHGRVSYTGAQIFEAIGLGHELVDEYFTGTVSRLGGIGLDEIAAEVAARHTRRPPDRARGAGPPQARARRRVPVAARGRVHLFNPETVFKLQHATRAKRYDIFKQYTRAGRRPVEAAGHAARPVRVQGRRAASRSRSTRSSRSARSSSGSRPAR